ncbi:MAG: ribonuclease R [Ignavibacteriae bacterium]|nr:ribonuclease R [Ignavibacteriota bacterium]MCB9220922.1 ribonuclease R [Ignavibacteria bacterium]
MNKEQLTNQLLLVLSEALKPLNINQLLRELDSNTNQIEASVVEEVLIDLIDNKLVSKNKKSKYSLIDNSTDVYEGYYNYKRGHSVVVVIDSENSIFYVKNEHSYTALDGDKVLVKLLDIKKGKNYGVVVDIVERKNNEIEGTVEFSGGEYYLKTNPDKYRYDFLIEWHDDLGLLEGKKAKGVLTNWSNPKKPPKVKVKVVNENIEDLRSAFDRIVDEYELNEVFPDKVQKEANKIKDPSETKISKGRKDIRDKFIITVDPADAKDFDDAISLEYDENNNIVLGVHIADVSFYVPENSEIDIEARERGNSTYLVDRVVPMLPEVLSNDICSLKPNIDRNAFSVFMTLDSNYELIHYELHETLINSKKRYSYEEALDTINGGKDENSELMQTLAEISQKLRHKRFENGGINFSSSELRFELNEDRIPIKSNIKNATKSTQMIEEYMLLANRSVTLFVKELSKKAGNKETLPFIYRIHEDPDRAIVNEAFQFIGHLTGNKFKKVSEVRAKDINNILNRFEDSTYSPVINQVLIRSMAKAIYSQKNYGHFGLGFEDYTHFTSPIRRYADLVVHRLLKEYMKSKGKVSKSRIDYLKPFTKSVSDHISQTERKSMEAERASNKLASAVMVRNKIGNEYNGTVTGVINFGLFLILDELNVEGLLHVKDLNNDYYRFDEKNLKFVGKRTKTEFTIGTRLRVKIAKINIGKSQIDFEFIEKL